MKLLLLLLLPATALAVPAGRSGQLEATATPTGLAVSDDERFVVMTHGGDDGVTVFDRTSFLDGGTVLSVCSDARDVAFAALSSIDPRFYVACGGGQVVYIEPDASIYPATWAVSDDIDLGTILDAGKERGSALAIDFAPDDTVVHAVVQAGMVFTLWTIGLSDDVATQVATDVGTIQHAALGETGTPWILTNSDQRLVAISRVGASYTVLGSSLSSYNAVTGVAVSNATDLVYVADSSQTEVWTVSASSPLGVPTEHEAVLGAPVALALGGPRADPFVWVGEVGGELVGAEADGDELLRLDLDGQDAARIAPVPNQDGAVYVAGTGGTVRIVSDRPFVSDLNADATQLGPGDASTLSFTANADGDYDLRVGGGLSRSTGTSLASGSLVADTEQTVSLDAEDLPLEGENRLFLFVDSGAEDVGNDSIVLVFDGPPDAIATPTLGEADERLDLRWMSSDEPDIATFEVVLSDAAFATSESLPGFVTGNGTRYPRTVFAGEPSTPQSLSIDGLNNDTVYYLALRAVDLGGQVGPFSAVVSGQARATCGAAECAGEPRGCSTCSSLAARDPGLRSGGWLLLGLLAWRLRRR